MSFLFNHHVTISVNATEISIIIGNPNLLFWNGMFTFIPQKLDTIVGTASTIVIDVRNFITPFRLFDIIDAYASIVPVKMSLYIFAISIACLFSVIASSSMSSSSSYSFIIFPLSVFSITSSFDFSDVVKYTKLFSKLSNFSSSLFFIDFFNMYSAISVSLFICFRYVR